MHSEEVLGN